MNFELWQCLKCRVRKTGDPLVPCGHCMNEAKLKVRRTFEQRKRQHGSRSNYIDHLIKQARENDKMRRELEAKKH